MNILRYIVEHAPRELAALDKQIAASAPDALDPWIAQQTVWREIAAEAERVIGPLDAVTGPQFQRMNALRVVGEHGKALLQRDALGRGLGFHHPQPEAYIAAVRLVVARVEEVVPSLGTLGQAAPAVKSAIRRP